MTKATVPKVYHKGNLIIYYDLWEIQIKMYDFYDKLLVNYLNCGRNSVNILLPVA